MINVGDLLLIGGGHDMDLVVRTIKAHCATWRRQLTGYSPAELALLNEVRLWKRNDPRPGLPATFPSALAEALRRDAPALGDTTADELSAITSAHLSNHLQRLTQQITTPTTGERP